MKQEQGVFGSRLSRTHNAQRFPRGAGMADRAPRVVPARVLIRPARPDDLEEATLLERRIWGRMAAGLNELQRRLFALPEAFLLAELRRPGHRPQLVGLTNGLIWVREFPRRWL